MKHLHKNTLITLIVATSLFVSFASYANIVEDRISVCVDKKGNFKLLDKKCDSKEKLLSWNIIGPKGEPGKDFVIPEPKTIKFADNATQPLVSNWTDVSGGYNQIAIVLNISGSISQYDIQFTNDINTEIYSTQSTVNCFNNSKCPLVVLPVLAKYYRISTGTAEGNVTSYAYLSNK